MLTYACELAIREAASTNDICSLILTEMPSICRTEGEKVLREDLLLFYQQTSKRLAFSAAGFFEVNFKLLLAILTCVTTNLIVIIQFNK